MMPILMSWPDFQPLAAVLLGLTCVVVGGLAAMLWACHAKRDRCLISTAAASAPVARPPASHPRASSGGRAPEPVASYGRIVRYIEAAADRVQDIHSASRAAARQIDSAEVALNRLLADVATVMPNRFSPTVTPRRSLALLTI
jgi:hypothetical protein